MSICDCNQGRLPCTCKTQLTGEYHADLNAALSELAALREELANVRAIAGDVAGNSKRMRGEFKESRDILEQRLADAERRNAELERDKARIDWLIEQPIDTFYLDDGRIIDIAGRVDVRDAIDEAMAKPTESGASECGSCNGSLVATTFDADGVPRDGECQECKP